MRTIALLIIAMTLSITAVMADESTREAAKECSDRSAECRLYLQNSDSQMQREGKVLSALSVLGRAIGHQYNCSGNEAAAMERAARREFSALLPHRSDDIESAIEQGVVSVKTGECQPLAFRKAMAEFNAMTKAASP